MSTPLSFVDHVGGDLAALAAALAGARAPLAEGAGVTAHAFTTSTPQPTSEEVTTVLAEIGLGPPVAARPFHATDAPGTLVELGGTKLEARAASIDVRIYQGPEVTPFGPAALERLALLRLARDRIEEFLATT